MLFEKPEDFTGASHRAVTVFGMSGVGKTQISALLRRHDWFHYSADYRIGTRYMGEYIVDNFKREAMKNPFLKQLLTSDSIYISSNITFHNLDPLSTYLGAPGNPDKGGISLSEYQLRQEQHRVGEVAALKDIPYFIQRAEALYGYTDFIADTGGSLIEVIDVDNPDDEVIAALTRHSALLYIRGTEADTAELVRRFTASPKPMYYPPELLVRTWAAYKQQRGLTRDEDVDPKDFAAWGFEALVRDRLPRYQKLADAHGYVVEASEVATVRDETDFMALMRKAIATRASA